MPKVKLGFRWINIGFMKKLFIFLVLWVAMINSLCAQEYEVTEDAKVVLKQNELEGDDSLIYELYIIDAGFESWLISKAKPLGYHSQPYLESWNRRYVAEWNYRYTGGQNPDVIESSIDYLDHINYGLELNYKLYNYFVYVENELKLQLLPRVGF